MNLKPTKLKVVVSLIVAIVIGIWFFSWLPCFDCSAETMRIASTISFLMGFFGSLFLVYALWSLFQEGGKKRGIFFYILAVIFIFLMDLFILFIITSLEKFF